MKTGNDAIIIRQFTKCLVCGNKNIDDLINLPGLPITGLFSDKKSKNTFKKIDQVFLWCSVCGHGQLINQVNPSILYDSQSYYFRTSLSKTAQQGTKLFLDFFRKISSSRKFNCIVDVGCNDIYLLNEMKSFGKYRVGIDPIWKHKKPVNDDKNLMVIGETIETTNLKKELICKPDLIVSRHTLEHISNPASALSKLYDCSADNALFVFEFPCLDFLVSRGRFDQIFHEHLNYFSLSSLNILFNKIGFKMIKWNQSYHNWGSLLVAFCKNTKKQNIKLKLPFSKKEFESRRDLFFSQMKNTRTVLNELKKEIIYGYGAALMLAVLAYHLKSDLSFLKAVIDDDREKDGIYYANLPLQILSPERIRDFENSSVFITAIDNVSPIMVKLLQNRPKHIIYPLHLI